MKPFIAGAATDLGLHVDGVQHGPARLFDSFDFLTAEEHAILERDPSIVKSVDPADLRKNETAVLDYNASLYRMLREAIASGYFPLTLGGDHALGVASVLAASSSHAPIGVIWVDAHPAYHTFATTTSGNIHGLPLATVTGYDNAAMRTFHDGATLDPTNAVVVGARSIDEGEIDNLRDAGVTIIRTEEVHRRGVAEVMDEAFAIAGRGTSGIHISYDLDVIDPEVAPGVSVPEVDGLSEDEAMAICDYLCAHIDRIPSLDLVEFNPTLDRDDRTLNLAGRLLERFVAAIHDKK